MIRLATTDPNAQRIPATALNQATGIIRLHPDARKLANSAQVGNILY